MLPFHCLYTYPANPNCIAGLKRNKKVFFKMTLYNLSFITIDGKFATPQLVLRKGWCFTCRAFADIYCLPVIRRRMAGFQSRYKSKKK
jgi:hypothetical protein